LISNSFSQLVSVFEERETPEKGYLAGYGALIRFYDLQVPLPDILAILSQKYKQYKSEDWMVFTPRHMPEDSLKGHLTFALKYEGIALGVLKKLFQKPDAAVLFYAADDTSIHADMELLIRDNEFEPLRVGGIDHSIRLEVFGDLHEFGALGWQ
jgi:hypothetical protein